MSCAVRFSEFATRAKLVLSSADFIFDAHQPFSLTVRAHNLQCIGEDNTSHVRSQQRKRSPYYCTECRAPLSSTVQGCEIVVSQYVALPPAYPEFPNNFPDIRSKMTPDDGSVGSHVLQHRMLPKHMHCFARFAFLNYYSIRASNPRSC